MRHNGAVVECPACGEVVGVGVLVASTVSARPRAWWRGGVPRDAVGEVRECVACGTRYTVVRDGRVIRWRGGAWAGGAGVPGAGAGAGGR